MLASDDQALVAEARAGDRNAFEVLYRQHVGRVHALCWRLCGAQNQLAEEMTQDAFVRAWQKLATFRGDSSFATWLHRVTVNLVLTDKRSRLRRAQREQPLNHELDTVAGNHSETGLRMDLEQAIAGLPERARTVLVLHDIEGYRHKDIADMTGMATGTSKAQLHRARKLLRGKLQA